MKNLFVLPAVVFGMLLGTQHLHAFETPVTAMETLADIQDKYIELAVENLPQTVIDAVGKDFAGAIIESAAAKEDASEFKLLLKQGDKEMEVFCDASGKWINKK